MTEGNPFYSAITYLNVVVEELCMRVFSFLTEAGLDVHVDAENLNKKSRSSTSHIFVCRNSLIFIIKYSILPLLH